jgi:hypothetical protein
MEVGDIVITISGGCVTGVYGNGAVSLLKYTLIDFDNLKQGDTCVSPTEMDGDFDSEGCQEAIKEAEDYPHNNHCDKCESNDRMEGSKYCEECFLSEEIGGEG